MTSQRLDTATCSAASRLLASMVFIAGAQTLYAPSAGAADRLEEVIVTAERQAQQVREFPGSISLLKNTYIALVGATHHSELVNRAPGALIQRNSGQESLTAIRSPVLSGPGSCGAFLFLENSVAIRPTGFCNVNELFEVHSEQAQAVEVLRGPAGVVYGSGAMHGAINVIQPAPAQLPRQSLALEAGPDDYYRGKLTLSHVDSATDIGGAVLATHDGGWRDSSGLQEQKLNLALVHRSDEALTGVQLAATRLDQQTAGFIQGRDAYRNDAVARSNPNPEAYREASAVRLTGEYQASLARQISLAVRPFARHSRMDFLQHFLIGKPLEENGQDSLGVLTTLQFASRAGTRLVGGLDLEVAEGFLKETQAGPATDGPPAANAIRPAGKHYDYEVHSQVAAVYGQVEQPLAQRWRLTAGARMEHVEYDYDNRMLSGNTRDDGTSCGTSGCLYHRPADRSDSFSNITSRFGLTYSVHERHVLYISAGRGYRAPDTSELYRLQRQQAVAQLDPERLDNVELGARGEFGAWQYSIAAFRMEKDNVIFRDSNGFNISAGRTDHEGLEYDFTWRLLESLSMSVAGTYARHTYDFNHAVEGAETIIAGRDIDTAPRHLNVARVNWSFAPRASVEVEWQSVGHHFLDAANTAEYGGHDVVNVRVGWDFDTHWSAVLRLNNVTDREYADRADFAFGSYRYFPGRERTLFAELRYQRQ